MQQLTPEQQAELQEKLKNMSPEELAEFQKQQCIFCQIIEGKIPSKKIYEDDKCLAILDINPATKGHLLLLPKEHFSIMPQIPDNLLGHLGNVSKQLSKMLLKQMKVAGTNIFVANGLAAGQKAQHFMVHVIPRKEDDGILTVNEQLIEADMQQKVKTAVQNKLNELLGVKSEIVQQTLPEDDEKEVEEPEEDAEDLEDEDQQEDETEEDFITSKTAKLYHTESCALAQNIKKENRQYLSEEMMEKMGKKPCTCISGKKIPLTEEDKEQEEEPQENHEEPEEIQHEKKDVDLDDIAGLFK